MNNKQFDIIIVGGSYSGLAAAMALGRALRTVLIINASNPCNIQTPYSHNFLTNDGNTPAEITSLANQQVKNYDSVEFFNGVAIRGLKTENGFEIHAASGEIFKAWKLVFATGIKDKMPDIEGFQACWGISVLHCPYCHGYEVRNKKTGILGNGEYDYDLTRLISNWTNDLTLFTNGNIALIPEQIEILGKHQIKIIEKKVVGIKHENGYMEHIIFSDGSSCNLEALYAPMPFEQHCKIPASLGCAVNEEGYIEVNPFQETSIKDIYACGDNTTRIRTLANAVATGTNAGMSLSKKMILEAFVD